MTITPRTGGRALRRPWAALVTLLLAVAGTLLAGSAPASAHAALTGSDPRQGAVVDRAPARITLTFSEEVAISEDALRVLDPRGERVDRGTPALVRGTTYAVKLHAGLPDGTYTVTYQVVSADSHPVTGAYTFSVGAPSRTSVPLAAQGGGGGIVGFLYGLGRWLSYAGFVVLAGGAAFVLACWQRGSGVRAVQRFVVSGWVALTAATLGLLLMRGSYTGSGEVGDVFDLNLLGQVLQTKSGAALVSRLLLLAAAALFVAVLFGAYDKREDEEKQDLTLGLALGGAVVAAGLAASWAMAEHASTGLQPGIAMPVDVLHLLAAAAWLGGLSTLLVALHRAPADTPVTAEAVGRFSPLALGSVVVLVVTGTYQSWRQLGSWSAFTDTRYGQLLLVKLGLVALLVGLAWLSRRWTARLTAAGGPERPGQHVGQPSPCEPEQHDQRGARAPHGEPDQNGEHAQHGARPSPGTRGEQDGRDEADEYDEPDGRDERGEADGRNEADRRDERNEADRRDERGEQDGLGKRGEAGACGKQDGRGEPDGRAGAADAARAQDAPAPGTPPAAAHSPERAEQLARQQAAVAAARRKRLRDADPNRFGLRRSVLA
ncbi:MAG TPA: copper resistance protein CopC, partial [Streptomyces sp.]|nr:copper resistance protein CopC [Streptomyces sp.]